MPRRTGRVGCPGTDVCTTARLGNALKVGKDGATINELRAHFEGGTLAGDDFVVEKVSLLLEDLGDVCLDLGVGCDEFSFPARAAFLKRVRKSEIGSVRTAMVVVSFKV